MSKYHWSSILGCSCQLAANYWKTSAHTEQLAMQHWSVDVACWASSAPDFLYSSCCAQAFACSSWATLISELRSFYKETSTDLKLQCNKLLSWIAGLMSAFDACTVAACEMGSPVPQLCQNPQCIYWSVDEVSRDLINLLQNLHTCNAHIESAKIEESTSRGCSNVYEILRLIVLDDDQYIDKLLLIISNRTPLIRA